MQRTRTPRAGHTPYRGRTLVTLSTLAVLALASGCSGSGNDSELAEEHFKFAAKSKWTEACALESNELRGGGIGVCAGGKKASAPDAMKDLSTAELKAEDVTPASGNNASADGQWVLLSFSTGDSTAYRAVQVVDGKVNQFSVTDNTQWQKAG
ncbi:hypothetical protein [Streptomyces paludis]|uniref:Lipoprotein n=1 Tax=Streptomyces paludis TaxID=2282738 RepID=A0A345HUK0_9ACTN|nr:hypothetical protein [Streptomyces paludis]AXG80374.1 hypothetical protein DVK44_24940 [Streptomyces paludis]